jgi:hypothetical protein
VSTESESSQEKRVSQNSANEPGAAKGGDSLEGRGIVAIWQDVRPEARTDWYEWHNRQHMPERVGVPGFRIGRRYIALDAKPEFFTLYETDTPSVTTGPDYAARLNDPTEWTLQIAPKLYNNARSLCRVAVSSASGRGGLVMTWRYDVSPGREDEQRALLVGIVPELAGRPGIAGVHVCVADTAASSMDSEEKKTRPEQPSVPGWVILVEGAAGRAPLAAACLELLPDAVLSAAGATRPITRGLYQLQYACSKNY